MRLCRIKLTKIHKQIIILKAVCQNVLHCIGTGGTCEAVRMVKVPSCTIGLFLSSTVTVSVKQIRKLTLTGHSSDGEQNFYVKQKCATWSPRTFMFTRLY